MTGDDFRALALGMPGAIERAHMGHPDFRVSGRIFASLTADERGAAVRLAPSEQRELMRAHPQVFAPAPGAWGRQGWTRIDLAALDTPTARAAVLLAWEGIVAGGAAKKKAQKKKPTRKTQAARASRPRASRRGPAKRRRRTI
ncbi:MAG TPA: MmcQ/YjbR family DNA-binding protein [Vicinamibacterales bacterium]|nr:MmcQ/YjbR family DNA-binding protein [Vicinamibacterales bacterium]